MTWLMPPTACLSAHRTKREYIADRLKDRTISFNGALEWLVHYCGEDEAEARRFCVECELALAKALVESVPGAKVVAIW